MYNALALEVVTPKCNRCGCFKLESELNGVDPFAPLPQRYKKAYCRRLVECDSQQARKALEKVTSKL